MSAFSAWTGEGNLENCIGGCLSRLRHVNLDIENVIKIKFRISAPQNVKTDFDIRPEVCHGF